MPPGDSHQALIRTLLRPEAYPWRPETVELVETHMSWVFLAGDRVVKVKRPVQLGFVDHSTLSRRLQSCNEEVRLNRRLTATVYRGTIRIARDGDRLVVSTGGDLYEWATLMRRLPADRMLDGLLARGLAPDNLPDLLAGRLIPFHRDACECGKREPDGSTAPTTSIVVDNLDELGRLAGGPVSEFQFALVDDAMRAFLADHSRYFLQRLQGGWVRDGHGDLRAAHICLEEDGGIQIFDCVEFNPSLRCADVASDLAFLLMDLGRLGAETSASALQRRYGEAGLELPPRLVRFYRAHRALVRAKVDLLTTAQGLLPHDELAVDAATYLDIATRSVVTVRPFLIAMTGLSGSGKSTVAASIARATGAELISSDIVRKELAGVSGSATMPWGEGLYSAEWTERTYGSLITRAKTALGAGRSVVLDASFLDQRWRERVASLAKELKVPFLLVETYCDAEVALARIAARARYGGSASDADQSVYNHQRALLCSTPVTVPSTAMLVRVDTNSERKSHLDPIIATLKGAGLLLPVVPEDPMR